MNKVFKFLLLIIIPLTIYGCGEDNYNRDPSDELRGKILITGSTSVFPIIEEAADVFMDKHRNIIIESQGTGSSAGIKDVHEENCDIGMTSRELSEDEKAYGLNEIKVATDGIAIIVNHNNPIKELSKDELTKIFRGDIKNWKELGGEDKLIKVITREEGSGTRSALEEKLLLYGSDKRSLITIDAQVCSGSGAIRTGVAFAEEAIGYVSLGIIDDSVALVKIDNIECTKETVKSGEYLLSRNFILVIQNDIKNESKAFIDFMLQDEGQSIVVEKGAISIK